MGAESGRHALRRWPTPRGPAAAPVVKAELDVEGRPAPAWPVAAVKVELREVELYPIGPGTTMQKCSSTTIYHISYHIQ